MIALQVATATAAFAALIVASVHLMIARGAVRKEETRATRQFKSLNGSIQELRTDALNIRERLAELAVPPRAAASASLKPRAETPAASAPAGRPKSADAAPIARSSFADAPQDRSRPSASAPRRDDATNAYRAMTANATHSGFIAWAEQYNARGVEIGHDGGVRAIDGLANAAAVLVADGDTALLFPGAPVVSDFSTRFQDTMTLRDLLGATFELEAGGGGRLKLLAPATLTAAGDGTWTVTRSGRLDGLSG